MSAEDFARCESCYENFYKNEDDAAACDGCGERYCGSCATSEEEPQWPEHVVNSAYCSGKCRYVQLDHSDIEIDKHVLDQAKFIATFPTKEEAVKAPGFPCICNQRLKVAREDYKKDEEEKRLCEKCYDGVMKWDVDGWRRRKLNYLLEQTGVDEDDLCDAARNKVPLFVNKPALLSLKRQRTI